MWWSGLALCLLFSCLAAAHPAALAAEIPDPPEAPWESAVRSRPAPGSCEKIDPVFVIPVRSTERASAVTRLRSSSAVPIDLAEVARLGFVEPPEVENLGYLHLLRQEIDELQGQRRRGLESLSGVWSLGDEQRLRELVDLYHDDSEPLLYPFLVRAVAVNGAAGAFAARICGTALWIDHVSRGSAVPPALRLPVVVYLAQRPAAVIATWSVAE